MKTEQKFRDKLYSVVSTKADSVNKITVTISINKEHEIFAGHFPGNPILPGVATINILKEIVSWHQQKKIRLTRAASIKYLSFINPLKNTLIDFEIELKDQENDKIQCSSTIRHGEMVFCSFRGEFSIES
jgi:3-hydroxyacyl-[acyl-carrier-protein] dehydratase